MEVEQHKSRSQAYKRADVFALSFTDDTKVLACSPAQCSFTTALVRQEQGKAGQHLYGHKSQVFTTEMQQMRMWNDEELETYMSSGGGVCLSSEETQFLCCSAQSAH